MKVPPLSMEILMPNLGWAIDPMTMMIMVFEQCKQGDRKHCQKWWSDGKKKRVGELYLSTRFNDVWRVYARTEHGRIYLLNH